jgi:osmotically-inducible protein OsmY
MRRLSKVALSIAVAATAAGAPVFAAEERSTADEAGDYAPDNTGRNVRDRDDMTVTSEDQSEKPADRELTQKIRRAIVEDDALSTSAHNVKIITVDGVVTLRGPVKTAKERSEIGAKAVKIAGAGKVKNQLETAPPKSKSN